MRSTLAGWRGSRANPSLCDIVLAGFLRIVTNPRIFEPATPMGVALEFCRQLLAHPRSVLLLPTPRHWPIFVDLIESARIQGPMVTDAYLAALAIEHSCVLDTRDSDFSRFENLRWRHPLAAGW